MATLTEIATIQSEAGWNSFLDKIRGAVIVKSAGVIDEATPNAGQLEWATNAIQAPSAAAQGLVGYVVGTNNTATPTQILSASDNAVQTNVDAAVVALYSS